MPAKSFVKGGPTMAWLEFQYDDREVFINLDHILMVRIREIGEVIQFEFYEATGQMVPSPPLRFEFPRRVGEELKEQLKELIQVHGRQILHGV
jgi:hypothetical protein